MPTTARTAPWSSWTGKATAAWAWTALAPGRTLPVLSSLMLQVEIGSSCSKARPAMPLPLGMRRTISWTGGGMFTAAASARLSASTRWWTVPATPPLSRMNCSSQVCGCVDDMAGHYRAAAGTAKRQRAAGWAASQSRRSRKSPARRRSASVVGQSRAPAPAPAGCVRRSPARKAASPTRRWHSMQEQRGQGAGPGAGPARLGGQAGRRGSSASLGSRETSCRPSR